MRAPEFWYRSDGGWAARMLAPAAGVYGLIADRRAATVQPWRAPVPVLCVGNLVVGGAGKTPVALSLGRRLAADGIDAHFLSRGYGGRECGPLQVDPERHDATRVGDEPLLLAAVRPTWVSRNRPAGARAAIAAGAQAIIMDDGLQNPSLAKDVSFVVVDGAVGFGNGQLIPAGPLREPIDQGLDRASAVVVIGPDRTGATAMIGVSPVIHGTAAPTATPVFHAHLRPEPAAAALAGTRVVAFAGIARPEKFFDTLRDLGCEVVAGHAFPDHYPFRDAEVRRLVGEADRLGATPVTTDKDAARLSATARAAVQVVRVAVAWEEESALDVLLARVRQAAP